MPGLFGSMSDAIIPGTGDWHFGVAGIVYKPFIDLLEKKLGLVLGRNLFIAFYDWRKPIKHSAKHYLFETIQKAKEVTNKKKVHIICHSMGGLVSRAYAESSYYKNDIDEMIIMCTPNAGSPPNFSYWTAGSLPIDSGEKLNLVRIYMEAYLWLLPKIYNTDEISAIHEHFKGLHDIVPSKTFGNYLLCKNVHNEYDIIPYDSMLTKNRFLDDLNSNQKKLQKRKVSVTLIAGIGDETIEYLEVEPSSSWVDGRVINSIKTQYGDGNAALKSVFAIDGDKHIVKGSHNEVLFKSFDIIAQKLGIEYTKSNDKYNLNEEYCLLLIRGKGKFKITENENSCEKQEHSKNIDFYQVSVNDLSCLFLPENILQKYNVRYVPLENETKISYITIMKDKRTEKNVKISTHTPFNLL